MYKEKKEIVMFDDPKLVQYRTDIEGWTGPDGLYHGKGKVGEERARYANSTHKKCECGGIMSKGWSRCETCRENRRNINFNKLEAIEWDGSSLMCLHSSETFFNCPYTIPKRKVSF